MGEPEQVVSRFETLFKEKDSDHPDYPPIPEAQYNYAIALSEVGEHEEALAYYEKVVERQPGNTRAWYDKAMTEMELDKGEEAINLLQNTGITELLETDLPDLSESEIEQLSSPIELEESDLEGDEEETPSS